MQLEHSFTVPVPVAQAWKVLLDIEQIAPCMPGAVLDSIDGDDFTGRVKVKLGPISLTYKGKASFVRKDEATHTAVIDAAGKDQRGNGTAAATVTATLKDQGGASTRVEVRTDLNITGKPAQFGRGVMVDVGNKLIGQFASCVEGKLSAGSISAEESAPSGATGSTAQGSAASVAASGAASATEAAAAQERHGRHAAEAAHAAEVAAAAHGAGAVSRAEGAGTAAEGGAGTGAGGAGTGAGGAASSSSGTGSASATRPRAVPSREPEPIDLLEMAGGSVATRIGIPAVGLAAAMMILFVIIRKIRN